MMMLVIGAAVVLTYIVPSGTYQRTSDSLVVPGTFHVIPKDYIAGLRGQKSTAILAAPASPLALLAAIPIGMERQAALIFMILFVGGMFGVLQETGALESGISRLVAASRGNVVAVVSVVMVLLAAGSSFLGLISRCYSPSDLASTRCSALRWSRSLQRSVI